MNFVLYQPESGGSCLWAGPRPNSRRSFRRPAGWRILIDATGLDTTHYVVDGAIMERLRRWRCRRDVGRWGRGAGGKPAAASRDHRDLGGGPAAMNEQSEVLHQPDTPGLIRFDISPPVAWQPAVLTIIVQEAWSHGLRRSLQGRHLSVGANGTAVTGTGPHGRPAPSPCARGTIP